MRLRKIKGYLVIGVVILSLAVMFSSYAGAAGKDSIGYVDMQKLQTELPDFVKLQELVNDKSSEFKLFQGYLYSQQENAAKDLEKKANTDKTGKNSEQQAEIDKKAQDEIQKKTNEVKTKIQDKYNELQQYINDQKDATLEKVKKIIAKVAEEKKLSFVTEKSLCFYGGTDITQDVIDQAKKEAGNTGKSDSSAKKK